MTALAEIPLLRRCATHGLQLSITDPHGATITLNDPSLARVHLRSLAALEALVANDHLAIAECYLHGDIEVDGSWRELMKVTDHVASDATFTERVALAARLLVRDRIAYDRESVSFHYDRPPEFFLPWLDRWRCYSHGLYARPNEPLENAIARKMQTAIDRLGLRAGMHVLDMGGGWGCFVEYAGRLGIHVHSITLSHAQHAFTSDLIAREALPCESQLVHLNQYRPTVPFDGAVFMGTFEHNPDYEAVVATVSRHLRPEARVWADFSAQQRDFTIGGFMKKHIWPGTITYVDPAGLVRAFQRAGFNIHLLHDDTLSYACTTRDWGDRFDAHADALTRTFGPVAVRAFRLFLRASWYFLETNKSQAYHLVAGRMPGPLPSV